MQEAKFSFNTKFRLWGVECQFTIRDDEGTAGQIFLKGTQLVAVMLKSGAQPSNGNGHAAAAPGPAAPPPLEQLFDEPKQPVCPICGKADELELVSFERDGKPRQAYKCQRCKKWLKG